MEGMFTVNTNKAIKNFTGDYEGGYSNIGGKISGLKLDIQGNKLIFKQLWKTYHTLDLKNITDVQLKTEEQISKDVTLTRLLAFGIFAFGLKKKRVDNSYYLIISTEEDGFQNDIVIKTKSGMNSLLQQGFVKTLREEVNKYRD